MVNSYVRKIGEGIKNWWVLVFFLLAMMTTCWALIPTGFFRVHDFTAAARLVEMQRALDQGQFPVRWSGNFGYGYGMPLFNFYGPLPYYIGAFFLSLGIPVVGVLKLLLILFSIVGWVGMYKLGKHFFGVVGGVLAATLFTTFPYRALDMYVRGAWNELIAMSFFPWILYVISSAATRSWKKNLLYLGSGTAALLLTHNLMSVMFLPLAVFWMLFCFAIREFKSKQILGLLCGFAAGVALSAFYWLPALQEKQFTRLDATVLGGYFDYQNHFLYLRQFIFGKWGWGGSNYGPNDEVSFALGWPNIVLIVLSVFSLVFLKKRRFVLLVMALLIAVFLLMTTEKTRFIWDALSFMQYFQFPWRFLSVVTVLVPLFAGASVLLIKNNLLKIWVVSILCVVVCLLHFSFFRPEKFLANADAFYYTDAERIQRNMSDILPDYIPSSVQIEPLPLPGQATLVDVTSPENGLPLELNTFTEKLTKVDTNARTYLWRVFYFPGWKTYIDQREVPLQVTPEGWMKVYVPAGSGFISLRLEDTASRKIGNVVSLAGLASMIGIYLYDRRHRT